MHSLTIPVSLGDRRGDRRILSAAGDFLVGRICEGETHGLEATEPKGAAQEQRRVCRRFDFGSGSASDRRPAVPRIPPRATLVADDQGRQRDMVAYGDRSKLRHLGAHRPSRRRQAFSRSIRADVSYCDAAPGLGGRDHAVLAPLRGDDPRRVHAGHRSQRASSDDPRPGGPSAHVHDGGLEAPSFRHPSSFHRMRGQPVVAGSEERSANAWDGELRRMDRRPSFDAAQGMRPERQREVVRRRRRRGSEGRVEHAHRQGDG